MVLLAYYLIELLILIGDHVPKRVFLLLVETLHELLLWFTYCQLMAMASSVHVRATEL
jgi:hypothetical protein